MGVWEVQVVGGVGEEAQVVGGGGGGTSSGWGWGRYK